VFEKICVGENMCLRKYCVFQYCLFDEYFGVIAAHESWLIIRHHRLRVGFCQTAPKLNSRNFIDDVISRGLGYGLQGCLLVHSRNTMNCNAVN